MIKSIFFLTFFFCLVARANSVLTIPEKWETIDGKDYFLKEIQSRYGVFIAYGSRCPIMRKYMPVINELEKNPAFLSQKIKIHLLFQKGRDSLDELKKERRDFSIHPVMLIDSDHSFIKELGLTISSEVALVDLKKKEILYQGAINNGINFDLSMKASKHYLIDAVKAVGDKKDPVVKKTKAYGCYL